MFTCNRPCFKTLICNLPACLYIDFGDNCISRPALLPLYCQRL